jgi:hypothetical protein
MPLITFLSQGVWGTAVVVVGDGVGEIAIAGADDKPFEGEGLTDGLGLGGFNTLVSVGNVAIGSGLVTTVGDWVAIGLGDKKGIGNFWATSNNGLIFPCGISHQ